MCLTDLDLDLDLPEITDDEQALRPDPHPIDGQYAGVAWGLAERHDGPAEAEAAPAD
jgi:hypothetical protein